MRLKKRECPLDIKIECEAGWSDVWFSYRNTQLKFLISYCFDEQLDDLLKTLYLMNPNYRDTDDYDDKLFDDIQEVSNNDGFHYAYLSSSFIWNEEPSVSKWTIKRDLIESDGKEWNYSFDLHIKIERLYYSDEIADKVFTFDVKYSDFCYAIAKAFTQLIKKYGFYGYHMSTYNQDLNMRYFLSIKSIALNNYNAVHLSNINDGGWASSLEKELELLQFDM